MCCLVACCAAGQWLQFQADMQHLHSYCLQKSRSRELPPESFPGAVVNSMQLDLASLYREVCQRGGFKHAPTINWAGQASFCSSLPFSAHDVGCPCIVPVSGPQNACINPLWKVLAVNSVYLQVFPRLKNYTAGHKMTGVGNALKRHYQQWLSEYEEANPQDVSGGEAPAVSNKTSGRAC